MQAQVSEGIRENLLAFWGRTTALVMPSSSVLFHLDLSADPYKREIVPLRLFLRLRTNFSCTTRFGSSVGTQDMGFQMSERFRRPPYTRDLICGLLSPFARHARNFDEAAAARFV
jgi:hypothetical protein